MTQYAESFADALRLCVYEIVALNLGYDRSVSDASGIRYLQGDTVVASITYHAELIDGVETYTGASVDEPA